MDMSGSHAACGQMSNYPMSGGQCSAERAVVQSRLNVGRLSERACFSVIWRVASGGGGGGGQATIDRARRSSSSSASGRGTGTSSLAATGCLKCP